jgi:hypothetical protein
VGQGTVIAELFGQVDAKFARVDFPGNIAGDRYRAGGLADQLEAAFGCFRDWHVRVCLRQENASGNKGQNFGRDCPNSEVILSVTLASGRRTAGASTRNEGIVGGGLHENES